MTEEQFARCQEAFDEAGDRRAFRFARHFLDECAEKGEEYAGLPMPFEKGDMVIHPKYPWAHVYNEEPVKPSPRVDGEARYIIANQFWRDGQLHFVLKDIDTKRASLYSSPADTSFDLFFRTMLFCDAWEVIPEGTAVQKLAGMIDHRQFRSYMLTGAFLERSARSQIPYIFRRLRPTIALSAYSDVPKILCTLCLHPIGFYKRSYAGAMVPTDDVIAHLTLMRGDEHEFWKQANQHVPFTPPSGL